MLLSTSGAEGTKTRRSPGDVRRRSTLKPRIVHRIVPFVNAQVAPHGERSASTSLQAATEVSTTIGQDVAAVHVAPQSPFQTGGAHITTSGATGSLIGGSIPEEKTVYVLRHGLTTWNAEGRIQGSSNESYLTPAGIKQAIRCRDALQRVPFDSPITRAASTAEIMWGGREGPMIHMPTLMEANLGFFQGMRNDVASKEHPELYSCWREHPASFCIDGRFPVVEVFAQARQAWAEILKAPGRVHLVVTHKSMLRAFVCVALGLPPTAFRCVDINNGGISVFRCNRRAEPMLCGLNHTTHMFCDNVFY